MLKNTVEPDRLQMIWHMCFACWIPKATDIHTEYATLLLFNCNSGYTNAWQCYVICAWPILFKHETLFPEIIIVHEVLKSNRRSSQKNYHTYSVIPF